MSYPAQHCESVRSLVDTIAESYQIGDLDCYIVNHDLIWFQVAVNYSNFMHGRQTFTNMLHDAPDRIFWENKLFFISNRP
jgi:hypothetical protein